MVAACFGVLLPWGRDFQSGLLGEGKYALALALVGFLLYALSAAELLALRWWRIVSVPLAIGCLAIAMDALNGYGSAGAIVTAVAAVAWLVASRRRWA